VTVTDSNNPPDPVPAWPVTTATNGDVTISPVTNNGDGTYAATITTSTTPGVETITATETSPSGQLRGSAPLTESGPASAITIRLSRASIPATGAPQPAPTLLNLNDPNGWEPNPYNPEPVRPSATATVIDATGDPVANEKVSFATNGDVTFGPVTNNGDGSYTAPIVSSTTPGNESITAMATRANVTGQPVTLRETFGALHTNPGDTSIRDAIGNPIMLRGLNLLPQWDPYDIHRYFLPEDYDQIRTNWGSNVVRAFLDLDQWMQPCVVEQQQGKYHADYQQVFQEYVRAATERGMFVILVLGDTPRFLCDVSGPQAMAERDPSNPADDASHFWTSLANAFKSNPLVGFELYNEPHGLSDPIWLNGGPVADTPAWTTAGMQEMYNAIRGTGAANLVLVDGQSWANATPPSLISSSASATHSTDYPATNIVYVVHYYTCPVPGSPASPYSSCPQPQPVTTGQCPTSSPPPAWDDPAAVLQKWVSWRAANGVPVIEDEFGWPSNRYSPDSCFNQATINFDETNNISWSAFYWVMWCDTTWGLATCPDQHNYAATISGVPVRNGLALNQN
jgi:aryl-phospho-beta-D-glucosidase BglC (GH1 family)